MHRNLNGLSSKGGSASGGKSRCLPPIVRPRLGGGDYNGVDPALFPHIIFSQTMRNDGRDRANSILACARRVAGLGQTRRRGRRFSIILYNSNEAFSTGRRETDSIKLSPIALRSSAVERALSMHGMYNVFMSKLTLILTLIIIVFAFLAYYFWGFGGSAENKKSQVLIDGHTFDVEIANTLPSRAQGLSDRPNLSENSGMLFIFNKPDSYGFWMKGMEFPLDMIWISGNKIVGFSENVEPEPGKSVFSLKIYYPPEAINKVLEVNAGDVQKYGIKIGDMAEIK